MLLAYNIAAVNIENAYSDLLAVQKRETEYEPFGGIVLTDTFQSSEAGDRRDTAMFPRNNARIERQLDLDIRVIIGNPPWSRMQSSHEDDNRNQPYPTLDARIAESYVARSDSKGTQEPPLRRLRPGHSLGLGPRAGRRRWDRRHRDQRRLSR